MADVATNLRVSRAKKLVISIDRENRRNEPNLTLGHLVGLTQSITNAFGSAGKIYLPNVYSLQLLDGEGQEIQIKGVSLDLEVDYKHSDSRSEYVLGRLYPDDIASIIKSVQIFVDNRYGSTLKRNFNWVYELDSIRDQLRSAGGDKETIEKITTGELRKAVQATLTIIKDLLAEVADKDELDLDNSQPIIDKIENRFRTSDEASQYRKIWEELGEELTKNLADHDRKTKIVEASNKKFSVHDARKIINTFYEQIIAQYDKKELEIKSPWDRASKKTRDEFNPQKKLYFSINEINEVNIVLNDNDKARKFINNIDLLLEELEKEPEEEKAATTEDDDGDDGGGEDAQDIDEHLNLIAQKEIIKNALKALRLKSAEAFVSLFLNEKTDPDQKDWLIKELPGQVQNLLNNPEIRQEVENIIIDWIIANLTSESEGGDYYSINDEQSKKLNTFLIEQFFAKYKDEFLKWMATVPSIEELKKSEPIKPDTQKAEVVVPDDDEADIPRDKKRTIDRKKFISDTTTSFIYLYFGKDGENFRDAVYGLIAKSTPENLTSADLLHLKLEIYNKLKLDREFFNITQKYYDERLNKLGLSDALHKANFYNALDSILVLIDDPQKYIADLSEKDIIEKFNLEGSGIHIDELRALLLGLIFVRRAHYYINNSTPITAWLKKDQNNEASQRFGKLREFTKEHGEDGVIALNLDGDGIDKLSIDEERKQKIKNLYRELWINTVAGKSPDELIDIYIFYEVDPIDIDYMAAPVPDGFIYSDMAQQANLTGSEGQSKKAQMAKKLFNKGAQKLGKAAIGVVAPELAPILAALENMPIVGEIAKEAEEKAGKLILAALGLGTAAVVGFINLLKGGATTLAWATAGGIGGFIIGGPWGAAIGAPLFGWLGGGGIEKIKNWFNGLGKSGGGVSGVGARRVIGSGGGGVSGSAISTKLVPLTFGGIAAGTTFVTIVAGGSQLHPIENFNTTDPRTGEASPYVEITKEASPKYLSEPGRITYTVNITPKDEFGISITDVLDEIKVRYNTDKYSSGVPTPDLQLKTTEDFPELGTDTTISFGETLSITYDVDYTSDFQHANVINYFTISFDYSKGSESDSAEAMSLTSVKFGEAPVFDGCWPVDSGSITQLPFDINTHQNNTKTLGADAIDIGSVGIGTTVYATFGGEAIQVGTRGNYGNVVVISGPDGKFIYAHLSAMAVTQGSQVSAGDVIGLTGNTGASRGAHLHYERANSGGYFYSTSLGSASTLLQLHDSPDLEEADTISRDSCN